MFYAQIDSDNLVTGISDLSGEVSADNLIPLNSLDTALLGSKYENGEFVEVEQEEPEQPEPDINELVQAEMLLNQMDIIDRLNTVEMGNAEMLLMMVEGGMM